MLVVLVSPPQQGTEQEQVSDEAQTASGNSGQVDSERENKTTPNSFTRGKINMTHHYIVK